MCPRGDEWLDPQHAGGNIGLGEIPHFWGGECYSRGTFSATLFGLPLAQKAFSGVDILYLPPRVHYPCVGAEVKR